MPFLPFPWGRFSPSVSMLSPLGLSASGRLCSEAADSPQAQLCSRFACWLSPGGVCQTFPSQPVCFFTCRWGLAKVEVTHRKLATALSRCHCLLTAGDRPSSSGSSFQPADPARLTSPPPSSRHHLCAGDAPACLSPSWPAMETGQTASRPPPMQEGTFQTAPPPRPVPVCSFRISCS